MEEEIGRSLAGTELLSLSVSVRRPRPSAAFSLERSIVSRAMINLSPEWNVSGSVCPSG